MSLFGNPPATPASGGLFGGASTTPAATPSGGLFGGGAATSSTPASGGLFGSATTSAPSTGGGLFGAASTTPAAPPPSGGLFGLSKPAMTSAPASGGLFGTTTTSAPSGGPFGTATGTATTSAPATGGLFGNTTAATSAPATGGLFGNTTATAAAPAKPSLFGATPSTAPSGGLFGATTTTPVATTGGGLFGGASAQPAASTTTGGGLFGGASIQQQVVPAATIDASKLTPTTRFSDCHPAVQQILEAIDTEIQSQIKLSENIKSILPAHREAVETIPIDVSVLSNRLASTKSFQHSDQSTYEQMRAYQDQDVEASKLSIRTLDLFRLPHAQRSQYIQRSSTFTTPQRENDIAGNKPMIAYFNKQADEMEHKMEIVRRVVKQVEESLQSIESQAIQSAREVAAVNGMDRSAVTGGVGGRQDARRLINVLREFNDALKGVSARIVDAREGLEALKQRR